MVMAVWASKDESRIHCVSGFAHLFEREAAKRGRQVDCRRFGGKKNWEFRKRAKEEYPKLIS